MTLPSKHFQNSEALSHKLSKGHYFVILKADEPLEISFYTRQTALENWSTVGWADARKPNKSMRQMFGFAHSPQPTCYLLEV
jgi:hypothetical protein